MSHQEHELRSTLHETAQDINVKIFRGDGLGYGEGPVGVNKRLENPQDPLSPEILEQVAEELVNPQLVQPLGRDQDGTLVDDDGCGDGREMFLMLKFGEFKTRLTFPRLRQKVFGGGLIMGVAALIGNGQAHGNLNATTEQANDLFTMAKLKYGAHKECGATIHAPSILENALYYKNQITSDILSLADPKHDPAELNAIIDVSFHNINKYVKQQKPEFGNYNPDQVTGDIDAREMAVTQPGTEHHEVAVGINVDIEDRSIDQANIRNITGDVAQLFTLDIPRLKKIADKGFEERYQKQIALVSELIFSFATLATLTEGDLPVILKYSDTPYVDFLNFGNSEENESLPGAKDKEPENHREDGQDTMEFAALLDSES